MRDSWDNMFEEVPASFEARMKETLSALEEKPKIRRFRFGTGALVAAALLVAVLGGTALATDFFRSEESHRHRPERLPRRGLRHGGAGERQHGHRAAGRAGEPGVQGKRRVDGLPCVVRHRRHGGRKPPPACRRSTISTPSPRRTWPTSSTRSPASIICGCTRL